MCFDALYRWRWPNGFVCPHCGHDRCCQLNTRKLQQCNRCHRQTSITAGTIFDSTKLPLTVWFQVIYLMTQDKEGVSAIKPHRHLGISYIAAWPVRHKLMQVMMERDREYTLAARVEVDDPYLGGVRSGGKRGRGAPAKTPFVAAVETSDEGHSLRMKLTVVEGFRTSEIATWAQQHVRAGTRVDAVGDRRKEIVGLEVQVRDDLDSHRLPRSPLPQGGQQILLAGLDRVGVFESDHTNHTAKISGRTSIMLSFRIEL